MQAPLYVFYRICDSTKASIYYYHAILFWLYAFEHKIYGVIQLSILKPSLS